MVKKINFASFGFLGRFDFIIVVAIVLFSSSCVRPVNGKSAYRNTSEASEYIRDIAISHIRERLLDGTINVTDIMHLFHVSSGPRHGSLFIHEYGRDIFELTGVSTLHIIERIDGSEKRGHNVQIHGHVYINPCDAKIFNHAVRYVLSTQRPPEPGAQRIGFVFKLKDDVLEYLAHNGVGEDVLNRMSQNMSFTFDPQARLLHCRVSGEDFSLSPSPQDLATHLNKELREFIDSERARLSAKHRD